MKGKNFWTCLAILKMFPGFFEIAFKNQKANLDFQWIFDNPFAKYLNFWSFLNELTAYLAIYQSQSKDSGLVIQKNSFFFKKKNYGPFLWMGFNCLNALKPLQRHSLLFTTKFPGVHGTHFINLGRMKGCVDLEDTQWFWTRHPSIGNPAP